MQELDIQIGMVVHGKDGTELGKVTEVWPYTESYGYLSRGTHELADYGAIGGTGDTMTSDRGYFQVRQGELLGFGGRDLYLPFSTIQAVAPGESVTVDCTEDTCEERYGTRPGVLDGAV